MAAIDVGHHFSYSHVAFCLVVDPVNVLSDEVALTLPFEAFYRNGSRVDFPSSDLQLFDVDHRLDALTRGENVQSTLVSTIFTAEGAGVASCSVSSLQTSRGSISWSTPRSTR